MSTPPRIDAHVRLDTHPRHPSAVVATVTGTAQHIAHAHLTVRGFEPVGAGTLVMARIDHEEPYWAERTAQALTALHITVTITPGLREAIDDDWTWANYPFPWCNRQEIRQISDEAQKIYDDIRHSWLIIHAHAHDGHTIVAAGSYRDGSGVTLHGENHLRSVTQTFETAADALASFHGDHGDAARPGPAPQTDVERQAAEARDPLLFPGLAEGEPAARHAETVPAYAADPADHDAVLDSFAEEHGEWQKWRTWSDDTTHLVHESQTLRAELVHEADPRETAWTFAAYETPVSDRIWHLTMTGATPEPLLQSLLISLDDGSAWDTATSAPGLVSEETVTAATRPLADAGWKHTVDGRFISWTTSQSDAGVTFDAFTAQNPRNASATWTLWAGPSIDRPTWAIHASAHTPAPLLAALAEDLAHGTGTRTTPTAHPSPAHRRTTPPGLPPATSPRPAGRRP
ncbi:DUF317 domain-containing protein [Streptomyces sp. ISL-12]|uniref:DUF317 domain-containing protein n=1 Tax=Streptomyces sp. ISL-12 TaxID=2819177 RepID=UPI001BE97955|nr:DUF317 domain-containing protein [Streptomyces sp. ISL-12]MBT2409332.1 DUF317 domain-containing protein [Streptomyces sp. ISL-12]